MRRCLAFAFIYLVACLELSSKNPTDLEVPKLLEHKLQLAQDGMVGGTFTSNFTSYADIPRPISATFLGVGVATFVISLGFLFYIFYSRLPYLHIRNSERFIEKLRSFVDSFEYDGVTKWTLSGLELDDEALAFAFSCAHPPRLVKMRLKHDGFSLSTTPSGTLKVTSVVSGQKVVQIRNKFQVRKGSQLSVKYEGSDKEVKLKADNVPSFPFVLDIVSPSTVDDKNIFGSLSDGDVLDAHKQSDTCDSLTQFLYNTIDEGDRRARHYRQKKLACLCDMRATPEEVATVCSFSSSCCAARAKMLEVEDEHYVPECTKTLKKVFDTKEETEVFELTV